MVPITSGARPSRCEPDERVADILEAADELALVVAAGRQGFAEAACASSARSVDDVVSWNEFKTAEPAMADVVEHLFDARRHKTIATIRADGSPRISGIESSFTDGHLAFGSMANSRKLSDLRRDPRFALHSATVDPVEGEEAMWSGEAKVAGRAIPSGPIRGEDAPPGEMFIADVTEVVFVHLDRAATALIVEWWTPDGGRQSVERT